MEPAPLKIEIPEVGQVSGLWQSPRDPLACVALAHGAGAGMTHRSMTAIADGLETLGVARCDTSFLIWRRAVGALTPLRSRTQRSARLSPKLAAGHTDFPCSQAVVRSAAE
jgi:predicted alpha/beta-hydrolase family hydrolase